MNVTVFHKVRILIRNEKLPSQPLRKGIRQLVERHGAVYKTSGAGGGDFGLALTDSAAVLDAVRAECIDSGYAILDKSFAVEGLVIS